MINPILDSGNLPINVSNIFGNCASTSLSGLPLGAIGNSALGEIFLKVGIVSGSLFSAKANAAAPTYVEGTFNGLSLDLASNLRVTFAGGATSAKQDTLNTTAAAIQAAVEKVIPATTAGAVTPSDSTALTSRSVWVGGAGDLYVRLSGAPTVTVPFMSVPAGSMLPISVVRVMAATTATNINVLNN